MNGKLTSHVLDISRGVPAQGVHIELYQLNEAKEKKLLCKSITNSDGRLDFPLLSGEQMQTGTFEMVFHIGAYYKNLLQGEHGSEPPLWDVVPVRFVISDANQHYHIPLLASPGGYSTYRGS